MTRTTMLVSIRLLEPKFEWQLRCHHDTRIYRASGTPLLGTPCDQFRKAPGPLSHPCRASHKHGVYEAFLNYSQESITLVSNSLVFDATGAACSQPPFSSRMLVAGVV